MPESGTERAPHLYWRASQLPDQSVRLTFHSPLVRLSRRPLPDHEPAAISVGRPHPSLPPSGNQERMPSRWRVLCSPTPWKEATTNAVKASSRRTTPANSNMSDTPANGRKKKQRSRSATNFITTIRWPFAYRVCSAATWVHASGNRTASGERRSTLLIERGREGGITAIRSLFHSRRIGIRKVDRRLPSMTTTSSVDVADQRSTQVASTGSPP